VIRLPLGSSAIVRAICGPPVTSLTQDTTDLLLSEQY
jgi:hypothetical protein